jgi:hypothetical protein
MFDAPLPLKILDQVLPDPEALFGERDVLSNFVDRHALGTLRFQSARRGSRNYCQSTGCDRQHCVLLLSSPSGQDIDRGRRANLDFECAARSP